MTSFLGAYAGGLQQPTRHRRNGSRPLSQCDLGFAPRTLGDRAIERTREYR